MHFDFNFNLASTHFSSSFILKYIISKVYILYFINDVYILVRSYIRSIDECTRWVYFCWLLWFLYFVRIHQVNFPPLFSNERLFVKTWCIVSRVRYIWQGTPRWAVMNALLSRKQLINCFRPERSPIRTA